MMAHYSDVDDESSEDALNVHQLPNYPRKRRHQSCNTKRRLKPRHSMHPQRHNAAMVEKADGYTGTESAPITYEGDVWEMFERMAFRVKHIDCEELINSHQLRFKLRPGYANVTELKLVAVSIDKLHIYLLNERIEVLQNKLQKARHTIAYCADKNINILWRRCNGKLNEIQFKNGKPQTVTETVILPLFLRNIKIEVEMKLNEHWSVDGKRGKRHYKLDCLEDKEITTLLPIGVYERQKCIGKQRKKVMYYRMYDL
eukprot:1047946_1